MMVREKRRGRLESEDKTRKEIRKRRQMEGRRREDEGKARTNRS